MLLQQKQQKASLNAKNMQNKKKYAGIRVEKHCSTKAY